MSTKHRLRKHSGVLFAMALSMCALWTTGLVAGGCERKVRLVTARSVRIQNAGANYNRYSAYDKKLIQRGSFRVGLDELALYLARGKPAFYWHTRVGKRWCRVLLYGSKPKEPQADLAVYTCNGTIVHWTKISPELPCWRLRAVGGRIVGDLRYFQYRPLQTQWEIVAGILRRGLTTRDVAISFGKPYNSGVEAREDGTNATTQVFLDNAGEAYGLYMTFIQNRLAGWRIPAKRTLTPEAQAKRLQATERRLMAQLKKMEAQSARRHREQMKLLNNIQMSKNEMLGNLARKPIQAARRHMKLGGRRRRVKSTYRRRTVRGRRKLTLNNCTFTDGPQGQLGRSCKSNKACSSGYTCYAFMGSNSGVCVPTDQLKNCHK
jgi:hypothetical protein